MLTGHLATTYGPVALATADALLVNGVSPSPDLAAALAAAAVLPLRRRWPVPVLLVALVGLYVGFIWFAPLIALYTVARHRPGRTRLAVCATLFAAAYLVPNPVDENPWESVQEAVLDFTDTALVIAAPIALGLLMAARGRENALLAERVLSTERVRLAREMHDVVAHQVSLISLQAGALRISTTDPATRDSADTMRSLAVATLDELRHLVGVLRAAGGSTAQLSPQPRLSDLPRLIADSGLEVDFSPLPDPPDGPGTPNAPAPSDPAPSDPAPADPSGSEAPGSDTSGSRDRPPERAGAGAGAGTARRYPEAVERAAFRTVQEGLTNARKHAPGGHVRVRLAEVGRRLSVEVHNGPRARDAELPALPGGGHGLVGLRERAQQLGGTFSAGPTPDGGFTVRAELPFRSTDRTTRLSH
ncbi:histidine kinase [Streptomyces sp. 549]|uniref:sensor histidine kinase n=1 Tax=Streptomyces sp. 549 TaxID=3049076 RepID=UPI0024C281E9|nr:sensor histidine kinase [Streptomyces sp. 549]MDK1473130.1 histidine kinase [Streptomyces sp. 549]